MGNICRLVSQLSHKQITIITVYQNITTISSLFTASPARDLTSPPQQEGGTLLDMLPNPQYITLMGQLLSLIFISSDVQTILNDLYCCVIVIL